MEGLFPHLEHVCPCYLSMFHVHSIVLSGPFYIRLSFPISVRPSEMLLTKHDPLVHSGTITLNRILKVNDFIVNSLGSGAKIGIVLDVNQVSPDVGHRIGEPRDICKEVDYGRSN